MADEVDRANDEASSLLTEMLRKRLPPGPKPTGRCLYCDDIVGENHRWCSTECRSEWEREANRGLRK